jgi:D-xylose transport system substrate-binding protein
VLNPHYIAGDYIKGPNQSVPNWDNTQAGSIFEQMMSAQNNKIDGVLAANDGLGNAAISVLKRRGLNGRVPVTGQDATVAGLQNILRGDQCMTVYKGAKQEAAGADQLAVDLANGTTPTGVVTVTDTVTGKPVKSVLLTPVAITKANVKAVVDDGYVRAADLCVGHVAALCTAAGIS